MIPLRDLNPVRTTPFVNYLIIVVNVLMFMWELSYGPETEQFLFNVAFIPARFWTPGYLVPNLITIFISMFLHGGFLHIAGNMLYLWIFGDNIEDRLGHFRYLLFYLLCGFGATMSHAFFNPTSRVPAIGASGAIAGVLGAYLILFPRARVTTLIPIFFFITIRELPAVFILGLWFVLQLFSGVGSFSAAGQEQAGGTAYFAHIGGFILGMILIGIMGGRRPRPRPVYFDGY
jgi:membrane associated rhomboid family serine protease